MLIASICRSGKDTDVPEPSKDRGPRYSHEMLYSRKNDRSHQAPCCLGEPKGNAVYFQNQFGSGFVKVCFGFFLVS